MTSGSSAGLPTDPGRPASAARGDGGWRLLPVIRPSALHCRFLLQYLRILLRRAAALCRRVGPWGQVRRCAGTGGEVHPPDRNRYSRRCPKAVVQPPALSLAVRVASRDRARVGVLSPRGRRLCYRQPPLVVCATRSVPLDCSLRSFCCTTRAFWTRPVMAPAVPPRCLVLVSDVRGVVRCEMSGRGFGCAVLAVRSRALACVRALACGPSSPSVILPDRPRCAEG